MAQTSATGDVIRAAMTFGLIRVMPPPDERRDVLEYVADLRRMLRSLGSVDDRDLVRLFGTVTGPTRRRPTATTAQRSRRPKARRRRSDVTPVQPATADGL